MAASVYTAVPTAKVFEQTARRPAPGLTSNTTDNALNLPARPMAPGQTVSAVLNRQHQTARRPAPGAVFRFAELPCLQFDHHLRNRTAAFLVHGDREEEMRDALSEWTECKCKLHQPVVCAVEGGDGCSGLRPGVHSALRGLYGANHTACAVEVGVRKRDRQFFDYAEFPTGPVVPVRKKYIAGVGTAPERMGAGYCYTHWFPDEVVVRVSRLLGPNPYLHRVLRYFLLVGKRGPITALAREIGGGKLHVERSAGAVVSPEEVIRYILHHGPNDRVGQSSAEAASGVGCPTTPSCAEGVDDWLISTVYPSRGYVSSCDRQRFQLLQEWAAGFGVRVPDVALVDYVYATKPAAMLPVDEVALRARVKVLSLVGDHFLKLSGSLLALASGGAFDIRQWETACTNVALAEASGRVPLDGFLQCGALLPRSKARANLVEAFFGVLFVYCGPFATICLRAVGMPHDVWFAGERLEIAEPSEVDTVAQVASVLDDFRLRGGNVAELRSLIEGILPEGPSPAAAEQPARDDA